jgi:hypothetical protein
VRRACDDEISSLLNCYPAMAQQALLHETIRRYIRTPSQCHHDNWRTVKGSIGWS